MKQIVIPCLPDTGTVRGMIYALRGRYPFLDAMPIGRSVLGREIYALTLGNGKQRVLYAAAFHGQEWITALLLLRLCEDVCAALRGNGRIAEMDFRRALCGRSMVLVPVVNPDGVEIALHGAETALSYAEAVRQRGGDTPGVWQANVCGVDLNRNYNAGWYIAHAAEAKLGITGPGPRRYGGPAPESEPETKAMIQLCRRLQFRHVTALHTQGEEIYWQYGDAMPRRPNPALWRRSWPRRPTTPQPNRIRPLLTPDLRIGLLNTISDPVSPWNAARELTRCHSRILSRCMHAYRKCFYLRL